MLRAFFDSSHKNYSSNYSALSFSEHEILRYAAHVGLQAVKSVYNKALRIIPGLRKRKYLVLDEQDAEGNPLHIAAYYGRERVVKYLAELGADINIKNNVNYTPMLFALWKAPIHSAKSDLGQHCYSTNDVVFTSCQTTPYDEIVRHLISLQKSSILKCDNESAFMLKKIIVKRMPLSLYALLQVGVDWNCPLIDHTSSMLLNLLHPHVGGREVAEVIKMFEINVSVKCDVSILKSELHQLAYVSTPDKFGNFFKPSLNKKRSPMQRLIDSHPRGVRISDECHHAEGFLPIHRAAQGGNLVAIKWFKNVGVNTQLKTRSGFTALDISIWYLNNLFDGKKSAKCRNKYFEDVLRVFFDTLQTKYSSDPSQTVQILVKHNILHVAATFRLDVVTCVYNAALKIIPGLINSKYLVLNKQDEAGNTPLHIAACYGHEHVVKYLVGLGADINIKNENNHNAMLAVFLGVSNHSNILYLDHNCYTTRDGLFTSCTTTSYDEIVRYLISSQESSISKCDDNSVLLLKSVILRRMPLSLYALLRIGVDLNCQGNELNSRVLQHLRVGGKEISEVLKIFEVNVSVRCDIFFSLSQLHLISYIPVSKDFGNWFQPSLNKKRSPLQRLIDSHPRGVRILDECYDSEGYLPIHRAAQGGNLVAIKWFKNVGVNMHLKTRTGLTALDISILYIDVSYCQLDAPSNLSLHPKKSYLPVPLHMKLKYRKNVFKELLRNFLNTIPKSKFLCGRTSEGLSPLHIAAVKGASVLSYVHKEALKIYPSLPINCVNKHQFDPVYLAQFYDSVRNEGFTDDEHDVLRNLKDKVINYGKKKDKVNNINLKFGHDRVPPAQYPHREIEYFLAFNYLYLPRLSELPDLKHVFVSSIVPVSDCPDYYDNDAFRKFDNENFSPAIPDATRCSKITRDSDELLCLRELYDELVTCKCQLLLKLLQSQYATRRRSNRQLSQFILKRLGWSDVLPVKNINKRWPFYFLHKKHLKKYKAYEYLEVLNGALEVADVRFYSRLSDEMKRIYNKIMVTSPIPNDHDN